MLGLFVDKFEGHDHGDPDDWNAHIKIEIRTEDDGQAGFAVVRVAWEGPEPGSVTLRSDNKGKIDERIGGFNTPTAQLTIVSVTLDGFIYRPNLNQEPSSIVIEGP